MTNRLDKQLSKRFLLCFFIYLVELRFRNGGYTTDLSEISANTQLVSL